MHELSICQSLIESIEDAAREHAFSKVSRVTLEIGAFAGVEIEALKFSFDVAGRDTLCEGASLVIHAMPGMGYCFECSSAVEIEDRLSPCPKCGSAKVQATGGDQLKIKDLEVV
ncbi:MAG: hydrogenase maturation nickel metallochaperone HypA [Proteobacteria bacterium]|nr:hydrogenase maturation nickel metallochaperone HypA [Pseudomonadota bacterium]